MNKFLGLNLQRIIKLRKYRVVREINLYPEQVSELKFAVHYKGKEIPNGSSYESLPTLLFKEKEKKKAHSKCQ